METIMPDCMTCRHFYHDNINKNSCKAFPDGIPKEIFYDLVSHRKPYTGDYGIQFSEALPG